ncbi:MAG TPA: 1,4-dihydroxy-6-naphthoate synthase [Bacteroidia bacterium]|nr:1,4-dihydroxy-6-naphthoate synthase [Bacteroidia bacterium]
MNHKLSLGFSPCPNDTYMFDAMVHAKINTEELEFDVVMEDVEVLNQRAMHGKLDVTKISFAAFTKVTDKYSLLNSGSALGNGVGPLLIAKDNSPLLWRGVGGEAVAIPGKSTTANFLFSIYFPEAKNKVEMLFSEIESAVLSEKVDAGVIIHESRFTYGQKGLKKICDLGELWEKETNQPIPLGGIAVRRNLPEEVQQKLNRVMRRSVEFAFANPDSSYGYVKLYAQEMDEEVRRKHIALYVNDFSISLGEKGRRAIEIFFQRALKAGMISSVPENIFMNQAGELSAR